MKTIGVIPCRYQSSRFPGKSLALINGKPMMWHVYQRVLESKVCDEIYVATDDQRIQEACNELGMANIMTRSDHQTGTDRLAEVANEVEGDYYINIQGDEPSIDPEAIKSNALAYSRQPIPYPQSGISKYYRQLWLYGFTKKGLEIFNKTIAGPIENSEQVEMYRFIENELKVVMVETNDDSISVDTQHDLSRVISLMQKK